MLKIHNSLTPIRSYPPTLCLESSSDTEQHSHWTTKKCIRLEHLSSYYDSFALFLEKHLKRLFSHNYPRVLFILMDFYIYIYKQQFSSGPQNNTYILSFTKPRAYLNRNWINQSIIIIRFLSTRSILQRI